MSHALLKGFKLTFIHESKLLCTYLFLLYFYHGGEKGFGQGSIFLQALIKRKAVSLLNKTLHQTPLFPKFIRRSFQIVIMARQTTRVSPCEGLSCFLEASGGVRPVKVALLHLHAHSRRSRQQASLPSKRETKLSVSRSRCGGRSSAEGLPAFSVSLQALRLRA